ncbi:MAG TPA: cold shock domain-containing protein [Syntrophorhabdaceae bacterium]|nr:cold shock domain-containing protein [Syntrophorhabdaceae bacterium]
MSQERVKWFGEYMGWGFFEQASGRDVFVRYTAIGVEHFRDWRGGDQRHFSPAKPETDPAAQDVQSSTPSAEVDEGGLWLISRPVYLG